MNATVNWPSDCRTFASDAATVTLTVTAVVYREEVTGP